MRKPPPKTRALAITEHHHVFAAPGLAVHRHLHREPGNR
jgi:hypothetical protein